MASLDDYLRNVEFSTTLSRKEKGRILGSVLPDIARGEGFVRSAQWSAFGGISQAAIDAQARVFGDARKALAQENVARMQEAGAMDRTRLTEQGAENRSLRNYNLSKQAYDRAAENDKLTRQQAISASNRALAAQNGAGQPTQTGNFTPLTRKMLDMQGNEVEAPYGAMDKNTGRFIRWENENSDVSPMSKYLDQLMQ